MKVVSLLSYIAAFLSGVLLALFILTAQVAQQSQGPGDGLLLREERRTTRKLQDELSRLRNGTGGSASDALPESAPRTVGAGGVLGERPMVQNAHVQREGVPHDDNLCSVLPSPTPTALSLWSNHLSDVFNATRYPSDDEAYEFHDFTALLLRFMTPDRLQRSAKTLPLDWTPVERGLDVIYKRWRSLESAVAAHRRKNGLKPEEPVPLDAMKRINAGVTHPRKLNVLVMGGSVTMGVVCHVNPVTTKTGNLARRSCAWPSRVNSFFEKIFGGYELVAFHTVALGGTNTESGVTMWDYSLLPGDVPYPDVVINAYATNDMHYNSVQDAIARNITLGESLLQLTQSFVRQVLTPKRGCGHPPPLLLYLDDYLGNEQNEIMETMRSSQTIHLMAGYYGFGSMSYAEAVRDLVYGDTREWWLSSQWYEGGKYTRAVHPHMGSHISMVWVVAFNLVNLVTTYCSLPSLGRGQSYRRQHAGVPSSSEGKWDYGYGLPPIDGLPNLRGDKPLEGGPRRKPRGIPPPLTPDLSLEQITRLWTEDAESDARLWRTLEECAAEGRTDNDPGRGALPKPCLYSWVAKLERRLDNPKRLTDKLKPHMTFNEGWGAVDDNNKLGWVPTSGIGSKFTMEWTKVAQPVRAVTWMIMRSYGEKWEGSRLKVDVWSGDTLMATKDIVGFHDKKTSETYNIKMRLDGDQTAGVERGSNLKIAFELIGGTTFKISGMAVCDH
ncbi:hypothetical protein ACHAWF_011785 [Thalassiosira exigua]